MVRIAGYEFPILFIGLAAILILGGANYTTHSIVSDKLGQAWDNWGQPAPAPSVTFPVTVNAGNNTGGKPAPEKVSNNDLPTKVSGSPATSWQWGMPTTSWDEVWRLTEPVAVTYGGEKFSAYVPENGQVRRATLSEIKAAWAATYGPGTGFTFSDSGSGANGWFASLLRQGRVEVYQSPLDNQERRKLLIPYNTGDGVTRYILVGRNQGSTLDSVDLKLGDEVTSPEYNIPTASYQPTPAKESAGTGAINTGANPADKFGSSSAGSSPTTGADKFG